MTSCQFFREVVALAFSTFEVFRHGLSPCGITLKHLDVKERIASRIGAGRMPRVHAALHREAHPAVEFMLAFRTSRAQAAVNWFECRCHRIGLVPLDHS